jgi:hypothetical protein
MFFTVADCRVVDHRVKAPQRVDLSSYILSTRDGLQVANHDGSGLLQLSPCVFSPPHVSGM